MLLSHQTRSAHIIIRAGLTLLLSLARMQPTGAQEPPSADTPNQDASPPRTPDQEAPEKEATTAPAAPANPRSSPEAATEELHLLFTVDIGGRYVWPGCHKREPGFADISHLITALQRKRAAIQKSGQQDPVVLAGGSMIRPDVLGNHLFGEGQAWAPRTVTLIQRLGLDAVTVGRYDFGAQPEILQRYLRLMHHARIPLLAANASCQKKNDFRCRYLGQNDRRYLVLRRGNLRVGVFSVVHRDLVQLVQSDSRGSLSVEAPLKTTRRLVKRLREQEKVQLVILLANVNLENDAPQPVLKLVRQLGDDAPDIAIADTMYLPAGNNYYDQIRLHSGPLIVGTDRFGQHLGHAVIHVRRELTKRAIVEAKVTMERVVDYPPDTRAVQVAKDLLAELCRCLNKPLDHAHFPQPMKKPEALIYLMEIMRQRLGTEIALLNDSAVAETSFPWSDQMTREKVLRTIRSSAELGSFRISGSRLIALLAGYVKEPSLLHVLGLEQKDGQWYVNHRPLIEGHHYRVATTSFVAGGGDGLIALSTESFASSGFSLHRVVTEFFTERLQSYDQDSAIELAQDFPDPWQKWLLYGGFDVNLALSTVAIRNGADGNRYSLPPLKRANLTSMETAAAINFGASTRNHTLEGDLSLQYGKTWTRNPGETESTANETADRIKGIALYHLAALKNLKGPGMWYVPEPYLEGTVISEFTASGSYEDPGTGVVEEYRYLDLGASIGAGLTLLPTLFVKTGFSLRGEALTPGPSGKVRPGLFIGYTLRRWQIISSTTHPLQFESRMDFFLDDLADNLRKELTLESKLNFSLIPPLYVNLSHRLYVFDNQEQKASTANDFALGLNLILDYRYQTF